MSAADSLATTVLELQRKLEAERVKCAALRGFANRILESWPDGDVDGGDLQAAAVYFGLLKGHEASKPCCEGCVCAGYGEFPLTCYRKTELVSGPRTSSDFTR